MKGSETAETGRKHNLFGGGEESQMGHVSSVNVNVNVN